MTARENGLKTVYKLFQQHQGLFCMKGTTNCPPHLTAQQCPLSLERGWGSCAHTFVQERSRLLQRTQPRRSDASSMTLLLWCLAAGAPDAPFRGSSGSVSLSPFVRTSVMDLCAVDLVAFVCAESTIDLALGDLRYLCPKEPANTLGSSDAGSSGNSGCIALSFIDNACRTWLMDRVFAGI